MLFLAGISIGAKDFHTETLDNTHIDLSRNDWFYHSTTVSDLMDVEVLKTLVYHGLALVFPQWVYRYSVKHP